MTGQKSTQPPESEPAEYASPPCALAEVDPVYLGYLSRDEVLGFLNTLLEAERAGAKVTARMAKDARGEPDLWPALDIVRRDEARFCAMLARHIIRLGGEPSMVTGAFKAKVMALNDAGERLALLNRGQGWVARKLAEALPRIHDAALYADLKEMHRVHVDNIARFEPFTGR